MMAFQAGGPHAQDRALEAVAYAWDRARRIPAEAHGKSRKARIRRSRCTSAITVVPRGTGLVLGCCTFPTWNGYPGLFADLATGNTVIVKPHPGAILPLAMTVASHATCCAKPDSIRTSSRCLPPKPNDGALVQDLALRPEIKLIDFTGQHAKRRLARAQCAPGAGLHRESRRQPDRDRLVDDIKAVARNIAFSLALYFGPDVHRAAKHLRPARRHPTPAEGTSSFERRRQSDSGAVQKLVCDPARAVECAVRSRTKA